MAEAIKGKFGVDVEMIEGGGGVFDVHVNGTQIWHKKEIGRFPEHDEVLDRISELSAAKG
ncbi:MAG: Rdx family protein [Planctomycetes bacterium]|nr:Rdx family protein [Planctomycetota bacterium]